MMLALHWAEQGKGDAVVELFERDFQLHVEFERLRCLRAIDDVAHHARTFIQFHYCDGVRWRETRNRTVMDHVAIKRCLAAGLEYADLARGAGGTERARRKVDIGAGVAALQPQFAGLCTIPEMLGFRCRFRTCAFGFSRDPRFLPGRACPGPACLRS